MSLLVELLIFGAAALLVWMLVARMLRPRAPAEPSGEPFANVPASLRRGPKGRSGAVAVAESDDDEPSDAFPPRVI